MSDSGTWRGADGPVWLRKDEGREWLQNVQGREQEGGGSLPLTSILLIAILVLTYFFGWKVLFILLAVLVVIPLGTFVYDRLPRQPPEMRESLGRRFATALAMDVKAGSVECLGGNRFAFTEEGRFTSEAQHGAPIARV